MTLKQKVMSGLFWTASGKFLGQLITWGITIIIIRRLSSTDYGLMSLTSVFVEFLAMINELGLGAAVIQNKNMTPRALRSLFGMLLILSVLFYLLLAGAAPFIADFYEDSRLTALIQVLAIQFLFMGFTVLPQSLLLRSMAFRKIATIDFTAAILGSASTLLLVLNGHGVWALVWGTLVIRLVSMIGLNLAHRPLGLPSLEFKEIRAFFSFGGYVTLSRILWYLYTRADILIIGKLLGKEILGFYAVGTYLATLAMEKVSGIINQVAFPAFSSVQSDPDVAGRHFLKALRVMSFISFPVLWGISAVAPEFVDLFLGSKWAAAVIPLKIIALVVPVRMLSNLMHPTLLGLGHPGMSFLNSLVAFVVMPIAFVIGSFWGLLGVSLAWVMAFPFVFFLNIFRAFKVLNITFQDVLKAMWIPLFSAIIMYACLLLFRFSLPQISLVLKLFLLVVSGVLVYSGLMFLLNREGLQEVRALLNL